MYTMKKGLRNKTFGAILAWLFALFTVIASFGIGNMTQGNSIASALHSTFNVPTQISGVVITVLSLVIIVGGIKSISKVSAIVVPTMAIFYVICGLIVIIGNISNLPSGLAMIFKMAFSVKAVNVPVNICGMDVCPGDVIHMDENGAVKFPNQYIGDVLDKVQKLQKIEQERQEKMRNSSDVEEIIRIMNGFEDNK